MTKKTINVTLTVDYFYDEQGRYADEVRDQVCDRIVEDIMSHIHTVENGVSIMNVCRVEDFEVEQ